MVVYGQGNYTLALANLANPPSSLPNHIAQFGFLAAKAIVKKSDTSLTELLDAYETAFTPSGASVHNELSGLQGGQADEYYHLTATEDGYYTGANAQSVLTTASPEFDGVSLNGAISVNQTEIVGSDGEVNASVIEDKFLRNDASDTMSGTLTATGFSGSGASLTALNATQLTSGTVPDARLTGEYTVTTLNTTDLVATNLEGNLDGTGFEIKATTFNAVGSVYQINGTDINTGGTLSNVGYLDQNNTFTGEITTTTLNVEYINDGNIVGQIIAYAGATTNIPTRYLNCDGTSYVTSNYTALYAVIGYTYGGSGANFNVPNLQGIFMRGAGSQTINTRSKGGGSLGDTNEDTTQGHRHDGKSVGGNSTSVIYPIGATSVGYSVAASAANSGALDAPNIVRDPKDDGTNGTPRTGTTTEPSSLDVNYIIKY